MAKPNIEVDVKGNTRPLKRELDKVSNKKLSLNLDSKNFSAPLGKIKGDLGEFDKSLAASNARVLAFGASAGAIYAIQRALSETVRAAIDVEKALTEVNVILGASEKQLARFGNELFNIAKKTGRSFQDVALAGGELARQGLAMEETLKRTSDAMILARLSGLGVEESVNAITAALNGFRNAALNSTAVVDKLIAVDQAFAVSGADLAEALRRVGSTAEGAGVSLDELLGIVTAAQQITARGGAVIGNSFKTIFTRIQRPKVLEALDALGVKTKNAAGVSLNATQVLKNLATTFDKLGEAQQAQIAELVGGVFQINVLKASLRDLSGEYSVFASATEIASRASGESAKRNAELNKTLSAGLNETLQNLTRLAAGVGKLTLEPAIRNVLGLVNALTEKLGSGDTEGAGQSIGKALLGGLGKFLSGPGLALAAAALFQLFNNLRKFAVDALSTFSGLNATFKQQQQLQQGIVNILQQNPKILAQIQRGEISVDQAAKQILSSYKGLNAELVQMNATATQLANSMQRAGAGVKTIGGVQTIGRRAKASGYVPNFADQGEVAAMAFSGMYTKSQISNPRTRRGKIFDGKGGSFMASYNGYEKKRDVIGPNGRKGTIIASPAMQAAARGFVPNFGRKFRTAKELAGNKDVREAYVDDGGVLGGPKEQAIINKWYREGGQKKLADASQIMATADLSGKAGIFTTGKSMSKRATMDLTTKAQIYSALGTNSPYKNDITVLKIGGLVQGSAKNIKNKLGKDATFDNVVETELKEPLQNITKAMLGGSKDAKDIPSPIDTWKKASEDTSGYPQFLGRIFESAINSVLGVTPAKGGTWDYKGSDFIASGAQETLYKSLFGEDDLNKLKRAQNIDAKRSGYGQVATRDSIASKLGSTAAFRKELNADVAAFLNAKKASGYVPNFYKPLGDALKRENAAGVSKSAIRVGSDRRLASGSNPFGLAVTNTRDEPRGIKDVLARGYVPNFVARVAEMVDAGEVDFTPKKNKPKITHDGKANEQNIKAKNKNTDATIRATMAMQKLFAVSTLASLATSVFASATEDGSKEMQKTGAILNSFTSALAIGSTAAMTIPGPIGMLVGAVAGAAAGFLQFQSSINHASDKLLENANVLGESSANLSEQSNTIQQTQAALEALKTATDSGSAQQLQAAQKKYAEALNKLEPTLRSAVIAETDTEGKQRVLGKAAADTAKDKSQTDAALKTNQILQEQLKQQAKEKALGNVLTTLKYIGGLVAAILVMQQVNKAAGAGNTLMNAQSFSRNTGGRLGQGVRAVAGGGKAGMLTRGLQVAAAGLKTFAVFLAKMAVIAGVVMTAIAAFGKIIKTVGQGFKKLTGFGDSFIRAGDTLIDKFNILGGVIDFIKAKRMEREEREKLRSRYKTPGKEEEGVTEKGREQMKKDAKGIFDLIDPSKLTDENMTKLRQAARGRNEDGDFVGGEEALIKALDELGVSADKARPFIEGAGDMAYGLAQQVGILSVEAKAAAAATARLQAILNTRAAAEAAASRAMMDSNKRAMGLSTALNTMAKGIQNSRKQARKNQRGFMMEVLQGGAGLAKQFQTSFDATKQEGDIKKLGINMKSAEKAEKIREKGNKAVFDAISKQESVAKLFEKVEKNQGTGQENRLVNALKGTLQVATSGQGAAGAALAVQTTLTRAGGAGGALEGQKVQIPGLLDILAQQSTEMAKAEQTRLHQLRLTELQTKLAQEQNKIDQQLAAGGGIKSFLDESGKSVDDQESGFNKAIDSFRKATQRGDTVKTGQAAGNLLSNLNEFMGTELMNVPGLKDLTQKGIETSLRGRAFARADALDQAAADTGNQDLAKAATALRNMDFAETAATQVAAEFKRQKMPANIESMLNVQNELRQIQQEDLAQNRLTAENTKTMADALTGGAFSQGVANAVANLPAPAVQGLGTIQTSMDEAASAMQTASNAITQAQVTELKANRLKDMAGKRAQLETELEDMVKTMGEDGFDAQEIRKIQGKMREIGVVSNDMAQAAQGMSPEARAAMGPQFDQGLTNRALSAIQLQQQGFAGISDKDLKNLGPAIANAIQQLRDPRQPNNTSRPAPNMTPNDDQAVNGRDLNAFNKFALGFMRTNIVGQAASGDREGAMETIRTHIAHFQQAIQRGGEGSDSARIGLAMMQEMMKRVEQDRIDTAQTNAAFIEEILKMQQVRDTGKEQTINIIVPAGASITGKREIYTIKNRLDRLEGQNTAGDSGAPITIDPVTGLPS